MALKLNGEGKTSQRDEPKALGTIFKGGNKGTRVEILDRQEWVVKSGAIHHIYITRNPALLHDYVQYSEA